MRRISFIATATVLTLFTSGCEGNLFGGDTAPEESPTEAPVVVAPVAEPSPDEQAGEATSPTDERVAALPQNLDLIPSTNPEQRLQAIDSERNDPFSIVATTPSVQISPTTGNAPQGQGATPQTTTPRTGQAGGGGQPTTTGRTTSGGQSPGGLAPIPNLVPQRPGSTTATRTTPPPPQPTLARAVEVLGVVQIGNTPYAIVNAPNEASSRYVREGQSLSNGQVVVRRIDVTGPEPAVVFEQFGIEVITAVGGGGAPEPQEGSPAAAAPVATNQG
ncbi:MAG: hypothetical protein Kow00121_13580 [Elainellaceae cyanobacterium]